MALKKRYAKAAALVDQKATYPIDRAVVLLKELPAPKFDETVELSASLNIDPKKTDQVVRGTVVLPHGTGKTRRVAVFCKGEKEMQAKQAGADYVGATELIEKIQGGWLDFEVAIATPDMMREVSRLGKILGPKGMMPNPKVGTVTDDVAKAINDVKQGKIEFKMDKLSNIHLVIGKRSFAPQQLADNGRSALEAIVRARPSSLKGRMLRRVSVSCTMSPGIPLKTEGLETDTAKETD
ncbi:MAG: 50S ribosomal protein L1 [Candidatus Omnitrophica bacterium]|nr:50S ribosomal protein L1 [Candidatus Omnitrophota bacterium]